MHARPLLAVSSLLLVAACTSGAAPDATDGEPHSSASSAAADAGAIEQAEQAMPPDPCTLLDRVQKKRLFPSGKTFAQATWTRELVGKDGNLVGCVGTFGDYRFARFGYALTPDAYGREYREGKLFGKKLAPKETPGLGDRGYVRENIVAGYEAMAATDDQTVYVVGMGARDHLHVVGALLNMVAESSDAMTATPVYVEEPCPAADSPEVVAALGDTVDVAVGWDHGDGVFCGYHDPETRTRLLLSAYDLDAVAGESYEPGVTRRTDRRDGLVRIASYDPGKRRYVSASLEWDAAGAAARKPTPLGGDDRALFRLGRRFIAEFG